MTSTTRQSLIDQLSFGRWDVACVSEKHRHELYNISNQDEKALMDVLSAFRATGAKMDKRHALTKDSAGNVVELTLYLNDKMARLPSEVAKLSKLEKLNIQHFSFGSQTELCLPKEIGTLQNLQELEISTSHELVLPPEIGQLQELRRLALSHCNITRKLPKEFQNLVSLDEIHLYNVHFEFLPVEIQNVAPHLKKLALHSLCHVVLDFLDGMRPSHSLEHLTLKYNQLVTSDLSRLCTILSKYPNLKELDLSYNDIECLDGFVGKKLPGQLRRLDLKKLEISEHSRLLDWAPVYPEDNSTKGHHRHRKTGDEIVSLLKILEDNPMLWDVGGVALTHLDTSVPTFPPIAASFSATSSMSGSRAFLSGYAPLSRYNNLNYHRRNSFNTSRDEASRSNRETTAVHTHPVLAEHMLDVNRSGRILFRGKGSIPLSVWPIVLGRVNQIFSTKPQRKANAMFYMVRSAHDIWQHF